MTTTHCVLVRHGETDWNRERRLQGHRDIALNERGLWQAEAAARRLSERLGLELKDVRPAVGVPVLMTSDLLRCRQTAAAIAAALGLPLNLEPRLREHDYGIFEGCTPADIERDFPDRAARWWARDPDLELGHGESLRQFAGRVEGALEELALAHLGRTLIVVTHGGVLDVAYRMARGLPLSAPRQGELANASLNTMRWHGGRFEILEWGDVSHWRRAPSEQDMPP